MEEVMRMIEEDPHLVRKVGRRGETPLHVAVRCGHKEMASYLIEQGGANPNAIRTRKSSFKSNMTPLHIACDNGDAPMVEVLVKEGANPAFATATPVRLTPLMVAAKKGSLDCIMALLKHPKTLPTINIQDMDWMTAWGWAHHSGHDDIAGVLADCGADTQLGENIGVLVPTFTAAFRGYLSPVIKAVRKYPEVMARTDRYGQPLLHLSVQNGHINIVSYLLDQGAIIDKLATHETLGEGCTALLVAIVEGHLDVVDLLLSRGADPTARTAKKRMTPLMVAATRDGDILRLLLSYEVVRMTINAQDEDGSTALHIAVRCNNVDNAIEALLEAGADPTIMDHSNRTPLDLPTGLKNEEILPLFAVSVSRVRARARVTSPVGYNHWSE